MFKLQQSQSGRRTRNITKPIQELYYKRMQIVLYGIVVIRILSNEAHFGNPENSQRKVIIEHIFYLPKEQLHM